MSASDFVLIKYFKKFHQVPAIESIHYIDVGFELHLSEKLLLLDLPLWTPAHT